MGAASMLPVIDGIDINDLVDPGATPKTYVIKSNKKPFVWENIRHCMNNRQSRKINAYRRAYIADLILKARTCKLRMEGSDPIYAANDIDFTVESGYHLKCLSDIHKMHRQHFAQSLFVVFDVNLYSYLDSRGYKMSAATNREQIAWSALRVYRFTEMFPKSHLHKRLDVMAPGMGALLKRSASIESKYGSSSSKLTYDEIYVKMVHQKTDARRVSLYSQLKEREHDSYHSIGAYIAMSNGDYMTEHHLAHSYFDNLGMICKSILEQDHPHPCNTRVTETKRMRIAKYLLRVLPKFDKLYPVCNRINLRRKKMVRSARPDREKFDSLLALATWDITPPALFVKVFAYLRPYTKDHLSATT